MQAVDEGLILLLVGGVLAASIVVALGASRVGAPSLVAFLALGMVLGSDGLGGIDFDDAELARKVGVVALAAILFEGGLATSWRRLRSVAVPAALLATVGVARDDRPHRPRRPGALRPLVARGDAARRGRRLDRRGGRVRDAPVHAHPPAPRAHAGGRDRRERPDGDRADDRPDPLDREAGLRLRRPRAPGRPAARPRARRRRRPRRGRDLGVRPAPPLDRRASRRSRPSRPPRSRSASRT